MLCAPGRWPRRRRAQWPSYRRGYPDLSTRFVRKSSRWGEESFQPKKRRFFSHNAASKPHCAGVLALPRVKILCRNREIFRFRGSKIGSRGCCDDGEMTISGWIAMENIAADATRNTIARR